MEMMNAVPDALCGHLAAFFCTTSAAVSRGDKIQFANIGACDNVTYHLSLLGFLVESAETGRHWPFELAVDADVMPDFATQSLNMAESDKQTLLNNIISYAGDCLDVPITRHWFSVPVASLGLMQILTDFGYAEARDSEFRWTELVALSMLAAFFWDAAGGSVDDGTYAWPNEANDDNRG